MINRRSALVTIVDFGHVNLRKDLRTFSIHFSHLMTPYGYRCFDCAFDRLDSWERIWAGSRLDDGTIFHVSLPFASIDQGSTK